MSAFMRSCESATGQRFADARSFHDFSVREHRVFWSLFLGWSGIITSGDPEPVCTDDDCEKATFFPRLSLSYVDNLLRAATPEDDARPAITACNERGERTTLTRAALRESVLAAATALTMKNVKPGDHVVAIGANTADLVIACLASVAVGATWSSTSPDMGTHAIVDRFAPLAPSVLFAVSSHQQSGHVTSIAERLADVVAALPPECLVVSLDADAAVDGSGHGRSTLRDLIALGQGAPEPLTLAALPRFPWNHPLFILFSSGTTGRPKCIVHGAGGTLIEHVKEHRLHGDMSDRDKLFFYTTPAWMMWNWQLSALACMTEIVLYDGSAVFPEIDALWKLVAREHVTVFGTSPTFLQHSRDNDLRPGERFDLSALRALMSTGSILEDSLFDWAERDVKLVPLQSISGGTDILGCFLLGNPNLPVHAGELQSISLGLDVRALGTDGEPGRIGELVCANPFPSRPLGLLGDATGERFHAAYFARGLGFWEHGDWLELTPHGGGRIHGRSDGVMNVRGVRIGPAEIYRALADVRDLAAVMAVEQRAPDEPGGSRLVLLVVLAPGAVLDAALVARIRVAIVSRCSPAHAPSIVVAVEDLPTTFSGKRSERAATDALAGKPITNAGALRNPDCLAAICRDVERALHDRAVNEAERATHVHVARAGATSGDVERELGAIWEEVLGVKDVGVDAGFFDLGGDSLAAVKLFARIDQTMGRKLPMSSLLRASTIGALAALIRDEEAHSAWSSLVPIRTTGTQRPFFCVHAVGANVLNYRLLAKYMGDDQPFYGFQARGLGGDEAPHETLEAMAAAYIEELRREMPRGPYAIGGGSSGGAVAYEMAQQLHAAGERVSALVMIDTSMAVLNGGSEAWAPTAVPVPRRNALVDIHLGQLLLRSPRERVRYIIDRLRTRHGGAERQLERAAHDPHTLRVIEANMNALAAYVPRPYEGTATMLLSRDEPDRASYDRRLRWADFVEGGLVVRYIPGNHENMLDEPQVSAVAAVLARSLRA